MTPDHHYDPYPRLAPFYDAMAGTLLLPFGGERRIRTRALELLDVGPGDHVLELGCGTGSNTRLLVDQGVHVTALDLSEPMLQVARKKVPGATFLAADILTFTPDRPVDACLISFVLHEMTPEIRVAALQAASRHARVGVLDFVDRAHPNVSRVLRAYLRVAEPEVARDWLETGLERDLQAAGLRMERERLLALGTARMVIATKM